MQTQTWIAGDFEIWVWMYREVMSVGQIPPAEGRSKYGAASAVGVGIESAVAYVRDKEVVFVDTKRNRDVERLGSLR
jgi:hypothetical protein